LKFKIKKPKLFARGFISESNRGKKPAQRAGFTIIEVLLAMGLFVLVAGGGVSAAVQAFSVNRLGEEESYAGYLASEGMEATRAISARDYFNLVNGSHGVDYSSGKWEFSGSSNALGKFARTVVISNVYRDTNGNIVASGGRLDLFTKRAEAKVDWSFSPGRSNTASFKTYFTYWQSSICTWDSAVQVGELNLPGTGDAKDIDIISDKAYVTTMVNGSAGEFFILSLANPIAPSKLGEFEVGAHTNAVVVLGNYAYLATSKSGAELIVVNISNPSSPTLTKAVDVPNVTQANDVFGVGNLVYVVTPSSTSGGEFYIYNVSNPPSPVLVGNFEVGNHVYGVYVSGSRAYLANARADKELIVLDVANSANPVLLGSYDVPLAGANGQSVFYGGGVVHLTTRDNVGPIAEYYLLEASDPTNISLLGSLDTSGRTNRVVAGVGFSLLATEKAGEGLMIIDIANPATPKKVFSLDLGGAAYGVALKDCYAYFASTVDSQEVKVVTPE
ncbi:MAG: hypothetical protein Q8M94_20440, partial [Ignavibacteria bacterium]|nr:hypothetical protein [Ignavibacteria bacterium]